MAVIDQTLQEVVFRFDSRLAPQARSVILVGSFNRWDSSVHRLTRGADGWWTISLTLARGAYPYLLLIDGVPRTDPTEDERIRCEWGGDASVRIVRPHRDSGAEGRRRAA